MLKRKGQSIVEYVMIFGVITAGAVASLMVVTGGGQAQRAFENYVTGQSQGSTQSAQATPGGGGTDSGGDRAGQRQAD